jgi:hypothetical protein
MLNPSFEKEIAAQLHKLTPDQQQRVLAFVEALAQTKPSGVPGSKLLRFAGAIEPDDLRVIEQVILEGYEQINLNEW